uniref:BED-type domain-containing protein n=1 Tax=Romanomermis culicivorax TaxID=13658 RepID=A0A915HG20_ROMCU
MVGKSTFQNDWLNPDINPDLALWVRAGRDRNSACCAICNKIIDISSMGKQALTSHLKSQKHIKLATASKQTPSIKHHLTTPQADVIVLNNQASSSNDVMPMIRCNTFAEKFCTHRWIENVSVTERALLILPSLKRYVQCVVKKPDVGSFEQLEAELRCTFLEARLEFFKAVAMQLEPFLKKFQSDQPLAPYLYEELSTVVKSLASRIVKSSVLDTCHSSTQLIAALVDQGNFKDKAKIDIGNNFL